MVFKKSSLGLEKVVLGLLDLTGLQVLKKIGGFGLATSLYPSMLKGQAEKQ